MGHRKASRNKSPESFRCPRTARGARGPRCDVCRPWEHPTTAIKILTIINVFYGNYVHKRQRHSPLVKRSKTLNFARNFIIWWNVFEKLFSNVGKSQIKVSRQSYLKNLLTNTTSRMRGGSEAGKVK